MNNNELIKQLKEEHQLSVQDIAGYCCVSTHTVKSWLSNGRNGRACPDMAIKLLNILAENNFYRDRPRV